MASQPPWAADLAKALREDRNTPRQLDADQQKIIDAWREYVELVAGPRVTAVPLVIPGVPAQPSITLVDPPRGKTGSQVRITGVGLASATAVYFGAAQATKFSSNSETELTAEVPTSAATGRIAVTTALGTLFSAASFTVE